MFFLKNLVLYFRSILASKTLLAIFNVRMKYILICLKKKLTLIRFLKLCSLFVFLILTFLWF